MPKRGLWLAVLVTLLAVNIDVVRGQEDVHEDNTSSFFDLLPTTLNETDPDINAVYKQLVVEALTLSSRIYARDFQFDRAIQDMNQAIELMPDNPGLYVERGQRILLIYEWDRVLADYNTAIALDPAYADAYFHRGVLFYTQGPREQAVPDFERYLDLAPDGQYAAQAADFIADIAVELESLDN